MAEENAAADGEQIQSLIKQLSNDDFDVREAAMNSLRKTGEAAWPLLEPLLRSEDKELASRIQILARDLAIMRPDQAELAKSLVEKLENADGKVRVEGLDGLLKLGPPGIRVARKNLSGEGSKPVVKLQINKVAVLAGEKITGKGTLRNDGQAPFWVANGETPELSWSCYRSSGFGEDRPGRYGRCGGCRRLFIRRTILNPILEYHAVAAGKQETEKDIDETLAEVGIYNGTLNVREAIPSKVIYPRIPQAEDENKDDPDEIIVPPDVLLGDTGPQPPNTVALDLNKALTEPQRRPFEKVQLFALPPLDQSAIDASTELQVKVLAPDPDAQEKSIGVSIKLSSKLVSLPLRLEKNLARYAWYVLLNKEGVPVKWGSWRSAAAGEEETVLSARTIEPGQSTNWRLIIPAPQETGPYSMVFGYDIKLPMSEYQTQPDFGPEDSSREVIKYNSGHLCARLADILSDSGK
jgi:hypothetical protein